MPNNTVHNILCKLAELRDSMEWWIECEFAKSAWCLRYHVGFTSIRSSFQFASSNKLLPKLYRDQTRIQSNKCLYVTNRNFCKYLHFIEMKTCTLDWKSPIGFKKKLHVQVSISIILFFSFSERSHHQNQCGWVWNMLNIVSNEFNWFISVIMLNYLTYEANDVN